MPGKQLTEIIIPKKATSEPARAIYNPEFAGLMEGLGKTDVRRASNVEPSHELSDEAIEWLLRHADRSRFIYFAAIPRDVAPTTADFWAGLRKVLPANKWWADLLRSNGPVLGPFENRDQGIEAELAWLKEHNYPTCRDCAERPHIQIEPPQLPVMLEDNSVLKMNADGTITRHESVAIGARSVESRDPSHAQYDEWRSLFRADTLVR